jgi:TFIIF-interacting CTD phosphatase-like protein
MGREFDLAIFTASLQSYADPIIDALEAGSGVKFVRRLYRESCTALADGTLAKDLRKFGNGWRSVVLVDNTPSVFAFQPESGIEIVSWLGDPDDDDLSRVASLLSRGESREKTGANNII